MYTKLDDIKKAKEIMEYRNLYPNALKEHVLHETNTTRYRAKQLIKAGLITLPLIKSFGDTNGIDRESN